VSDPAPLPPPLIPSSALRVERRTDPVTGQVISYYVDVRTGQKAPLAETFHLSTDPSKFDPPPVP
jgi:hypothetical protein